MFSRTLSVAALTLISVGLVVSSGCTTYGPSIMGSSSLMGIPIPVSPYVQDKLEDDSWDQERYATVPILGPIIENPHTAKDPPSEDEVMRALEDARPIEGGLPFLHETQRNDVKIVVEPIADYVDPPRVYPLIGPAQLHHAQYKCIVYFSETTRVGWPVPYTRMNEDAQEVIYIDHDHLHMVGNVDAGPGSDY